MSRRCPFAGLLEPCRMRVSWPHPRGLSLTKSKALRCISIVWEAVKGLRRSIPSDSDASRIGYQCVAQGLVHPEHLTETSPPSRSYQSVSAGNTSIQRI